MFNKKNGFVFCIIIIFLPLSTFRLDTYPESPIASINKDSILKKLQSSSNDITYLTADNDYLYYITDFDNGNAVQRIIKLMENNGYLYISPEESGYNFKKHDKQIVISTEMWTDKFMIFKIPSTL